MPESSGPFESEREAREAAHQMVSPPPGWSILRHAENRVLLTQACETAGVTLGAYDGRILGWLAEWEDSVCAVVAGLILRAAERKDEDG